MEVSSQLHAPAALPNGKDLPLPIGYAAGRIPEQVCALWNREKPLAPALVSFVFSISLSRKIPE
jgi:hypothetical protein